MSLDQLYLARPLPSISDYRAPIKGLYLCGSGSHPGWSLIPDLWPCNEKCSERIYAVVILGILWYFMRHFSFPSVLVPLAGGGVMGSPGWNAALTAIRDLKRN